MSDQGCQENSLAAPHDLISEGFIARRKPFMSAENPALFDAPFLKRHLGTLTQYLRTHLRGSAFLFQFIFPLSGSSAHRDAFANVAEGVRP